MANGKWQMADGEWTLRVADSRPIVHSSFVIFHLSFFILHCFIVHFSMNLVWKRPARRFHRLRNFQATVRDTLVLINEFKFTPDRFQHSGLCDGLAVLPAHAHKRR